MASAWTNFKNIFLRLLFTSFFSQNKIFIFIFHLFHFERVNHGRISHILCVKSSLDLLYCKKKLFAFFFLTNKLTLINDETEAEYIRGKVLYKIRLIQKHFFPQFCSTSATVPTSIRINTFYPICQVVNEFTGPVFFT